MATRRDIFFKFLGESGKSNVLDTGSLMGWYDWTAVFPTGNGKYILNSKHSDPANDCIIDNLYLDSEKYPLVRMASGAAYTHQSGKGYFDTDTRFQMVGDFYSDEFMFLLDIGPFDKEKDRNKSKIILTTMDSPTGLSGFSLGVNGANKLFFEFINNNGEKEIITSNSIPINDRNIISLAYKNQVAFTRPGGVFDKFGNELQNAPKTIETDSYYEITNHNISANPTSSKLAGTNKLRVDNVPHTSSKTLNIGGYANPDGNSQGLSGYINNLAIFSGVTLDENQRGRAAQSFALADYTAPATGRNIYFETLITGSGVTNVQVTGTGITGYELKPKPGPDGDTVYFNSGVTGQLSGDVVTFATGVSGEFTGSGNFHFADNFIYKSLEDVSGVRSYFERTITPEVAVLQSTQILEYAPSGLVFFEPLDPGETIQFTSFTGTTGVGQVIGTPSEVGQIQVCPGQQNTNNMPQISGVAPGEAMITRPSVINLGPGGATFGGWLDERGKNPKITKPANSDRSLGAQGEASSQQRKDLLE